MRRWTRLRAVTVVAGAALAIFAVGPRARASSTTTYSYDAWGRVTGATYSGSANVTTGYVYDAAGNRTQASTISQPTANPVAFVTVANSPANPVALSVAGPFTSVGVPTGAGHGTATPSGVSITYAPTPAYAGPDSFTYTATNGAGVSAPATVLIAVSPKAFGVSPTVAANSVNNPVSPTVVGAYTSLGIATRPSHGAATTSGTSMYYTPAPGYSGSDSFKYTAANAVATSPPVNVNVTVSP
jgi:YD repeat-containing protein